MKLFKTYIIEIIYECGNCSGIELPSLQLVKHGGTGIFPIQWTTPRCLWSGSAQVSDSACTNNDPFIHHEGTL